MAMEMGPFIFGGNVLGWTVQQDEAFRLLDAFVEKGGKAIDTADVYSQWAPGAEGGESEKIIGAWLTSRKARNKVVVATKVGKWSRHPGLAAFNIRAAIEGSLQRLKTDYVDLYYAHRDDETVEQSEYLAAFDDLVKQGKVRALGASNFTAARLASALKISREQGLRPLEYAQDEWNLVAREIEKEKVPFLAREGVQELPYYALASGFLTGKYRPGAKVESSRAQRAGGYLSTPANVDLLGVLDEVAASHKVSVTAVSLAWLKAQSVVGAPIASARTVEQLGALFEAGTFTLTPAELARLSATTAPS